MTDNTIWKAWSDVLIFEPGEVPDAEGNLFHLTDTPDEDAHSILNMLGICVAGSMFVTIGNTTTMVDEAGKVKAYIIAVSPQQIKPTIVRWAESDD